jgi:hypothetical protein
MRRTVENNTLSGKIYRYFLYTTIFLLVADLFSRFDGKTEQIFVAFNHTGNFILFILNPCLSAMWLLYVHNVIFCDNRKTLSVAKPLIVFALFNAVLTIVSQFTGWYYTIDMSNIYHRGPLFLFPGITDEVIMLAAVALLFANRNRIEKKYYTALLFFGVPPMICVFLQLFI